MNEGSNARAWVYIKLREEQGIPPTYIPNKTKLLTGGGGMIVNEKDLDQSLREGGEVFETMHELTLYRSHNEIHFYTWDDSICCLPKGATCATLRNDGNVFDLFLFSWQDVPGSCSETLKHFLKKRFSLDWIEGLEFEKIDKWTDREKIIASGQVHYLCIELNMERSIATLTVEGVVLDRFTVKLEGGEEDGADLKLYALTLKVGDYLLFEEVRSPSSSDDNNNSNNSIEDIAAPIPTELSSSPPPPDPLHRHVVRLTKVESYAPQAFRRQERAVIESDYVEVLRKHPEVQRASVAFRWFGSWYTVLLTIDRFGGKKVDEAFRYRLAGLDMEINELEKI